MSEQADLDVLMQILILTQSMQQKATDEVWDDLAGIDQQRHTLITAVFPLNDVVDNNAVRALVEKIIEENALLEVQCQQAKQVFKLQLNDLSKNKTAVAAYSST